ncbi:MAG: AAA family ATPase [Deltaproteobacteria bacterium]|nr:AAA family ATPase [Deltaproteobacteria bacterium]
MPRKKTEKEVPVEQLRWRLDPATLPFETTDDLEPLKEIIGQNRGVEAFRFGMGIKKPGYNVFVTGIPGTGRMSTVRRLLQEISKKDGRTPEDLCYVNNFKNPEAPVLVHLKAGQGRRFKKDVHDFIETLKREIPQLFESQEYLNRKKEIMAEYERKGKSFFKDLDKKVREQGFALVDIQMGQIKRPEVMPLVDGNPVPIDQIEAMVEKGRFPKDEFEDLKEKQQKLREEIDQIFLELRDLQKGVQENIEKMDRLMFSKFATEYVTPLKKRYRNKVIDRYFDDMIEDMTEHLEIFSAQGVQAVTGVPFLLPEGDRFQPYRVNLLVDNAESEGPPVIVESFPTYRNLFGSIERVVDRSGVWRTDFSKIKAGSLVKANGGYLVLNLMDAIVEPGVWQALKRSLKSKKMEIQTYDPFYFFTTTGLKPEPIELNVKVVVISDLYLYHLLLAYDEDVKKIFKVRADFDISMDKNDQSIRQFAEFVKRKTDEDKLRPFDRSAVAALVEEAVRMAGRQEKISTSFPTITDLIREADYFAGEEGHKIVLEKHVDQAIRARIYRSNMIEEHIQEMIDRGTLMIDVDGEAVGQVNGLAVYNLGDYMFGKPSRITASTSMGRAGIINIEREADLSGNTHNKGILILGGYLRKKYAQDKPLTMSASIAFEQSYSGVDGDSASSTEIYALLSSLSEVPIRQYIAVTGSVNQKGEIQAIGGVNPKIEGFFDCCRHVGLTGKQGVMIPQSNLKDLMLRKDVVEAVKKGQFHIYAVRTIDEGIEVLTGVKAGEKRADGTYPKGTINALVDEKLRSLAEGLKKFGEEEKKTAKRKKSSRKTKK